MDEMSILSPEAPPSPLDVARIREDFPILRETTHGKPIVYLDNAASTQKPRAVIDAIARHYERNNANVHRGIHELSNRATDAYDHARSEEHTSELQSRQYLVCRLLLE